MNDIYTITLAQLSKYAWQLIAPAGHPLTGIHYFDEIDEACDWARRWMSSNPSLRELRVELMEAK